MTEWDEGTRPLSHKKPRGTADTCADPLKLDLNSNFRGSFYETLQEISA